MSQNNENFAHEHLDQMMSECAIKATEFSLKDYGIFLDFSADSIEKVEEIMENLHKLIVLDNNDPIDPELIVTLCNWFGGYIGEVFKKTYGGHWRYDLRDSEAPAIELAVKGLGAAFPSRVFHRILGGEENNISFYYEQLLEKMDSIEEEINELQELKNHRLN